MATVTSNVIELHFEQKDDRVIVTPPDRDKMLLSVQAAIEACRAFKHQIEFKDQFDHLLDILAQWTHDHAKFLKRAHLTVRDSGLLFLVVMSGRQFDEELENELTNLDIEIANDSAFNLINLNVIAIPAGAEEEDVRSFLSPRLAVRYIKLDGK